LTIFVIGADKSHYLNLKVDRIHGLRRPTHTHTQTRTFYIGNYYWYKCELYNIMLILYLSTAIIGIEFLFVSNANVSYFCSTQVRQSVKNSGFIILLFDKQPELIFILGQKVRNYKIFYSILIESQNCIF